jgi:hypothetical protein
VSAVALALPLTPTRALLGRSFVHPLFDLLVVGGGLSLLVTAWILVDPGGSARALAPWAPACLLLSNSAHFAASTVRLYTREGARERWPFLTVGVPLVTLVLLTAAIAFSDHVGRQITALYLTWSPFHYAAQAFGLAVMYTYRAGDELHPAERIALRWACLFPFLRVLVSTPSYGVRALIPAAVLHEDPILGRTLLVLGQGFGVLAVLAPVLLFAAHWARARRPLPLVSILVVLSNAAWWLVLRERTDDAFLWATVFHGLQYLGITLVFHVRDRQARSGYRGALWEAGGFYGLCIVAGYALFQCWPWAFVAAGYSMVASVIMVTAAINIHHFVVDAFIWKIRADPNARVVGGAAA